jgi:hypothetical protein
MVYWACARYARIKCSRWKEASDMTMDKARTSAKLRHSIEIARKCGFEYNEERFRYGGWFDLFQLERILAKIQELEMKIAGLTQKQIDKIR